MLLNLATDYRPTNYSTLHHHTGIITNEIRSYFRGFQHLSG